MEDLRQELIKKGWKQGVILEPKPFGDQSAIGFLVLNQTCDCVNSDISKTGKEPYFELLPLYKRNSRKGNPDPNFENGKNPREIHFRLTRQGEQCCVEARIRQITLAYRKDHQNFSFSESLEIPSAVLSDILAWRAARYLRPAFPDSFEEAFRPLKDEFTALLTENGVDQLIDSILIRLDHYDDLEDEGDAYDLTLRLMITPEVEGRDSDVGKVENLVEPIKELFARSNAFPEPKCSVVNLVEMNLWERRKFLDFSRFDYLSFGDD